MYPNVYLFREKENKYEIYLGEFTTLDGIKLFENETQIEITSFGATNYKNFGWATENDIPKFENIRELIMFFESESDFGLIVFEMILNNIGKLSTHDDGECNIVLNSKQYAYNLIKKVSPIIYQDLILSELIKHQDNYITISEKGNINRFITFEQYIRRK